MHHAFSDIDQDLVAQVETVTHHITGSALQPAYQGLLMGRCSELGAREIHNHKTLAYQRCLRSCVAMLEASEDVSQLVRDRMGALGLLTSRDTINSTNTYAAFFSPKLRCQFSVRAT
jgi:hypothetical protein